MKKKYVVLIRGINVGGKNSLKMNELKVMLLKLGYGDIKTYIQSGNIIFTAEDATADDIAEQIHSSISKEFNFNVSVIVMASSEFNAIIDRNPFQGITDDLKKVHIAFLKDKADQEGLSLLYEIKSETEQYELTDNALYIYTPEGIGRSKLVTQIENVLGVQMTMRNLRTVLKIKVLL